MISKCPCVRNPQVVVYNRDARQLHNALRLGVPVCGHPQIVHGGLTSVRRRMARLCMAAGAQPLMTAALGGPALTTWHWGAAGPLSAGAAPWLLLRPPVASRAASGSLPPLSSPAPHCIPLPHFSPRQAILDETFGALLYSMRRDGQAEFHRCGAPGCLLPHPSAPSLVMISVILETPPTASHATPL